MAPKSESNEAEWKSEAKQVEKRKSEGRLQQWYETVTCVKISTHSDLFKVGLNAEVMPNKMLYVKPSARDPALSKQLEEKIAEYFPELGVVTQESIGDRVFVDCVRIGCLGDIFRLALREKTISPVSLVVPSETAWAEKIRIREKVADGFPRINLIEFEFGKSNSGKWVFGILGSMVIVGIVCLNLKEAKKEVGKHVGTIIVSVASVAASIKNFVDTWAAKGCPPLVQCTVRPALWNWTRNGSEK